MRGRLRELSRRLRGRPDRATCHHDEQRLKGMERTLDALRLQLGTLQVAQQRHEAPGDLHAAEFRVYSQFGEDGILQFLIGRIPSIPRSFVEFGVQTYEEANTRFLLQHDNWRGLILDGSAALSNLRSDELYWRHDLQAVVAFIDRDNINQLIGEAGFRGPIGLLSIDIDGNDYWVWERIDVVDPVIVVAEYNSIFGCSRAVSVPYAAGFRRTDAHASNLYWGCSLPALCHLAARKGYTFVGSNRAGNNAFFVREGFDAGLPKLTAAEGYVESRFRESRDAHGELTFLAGDARLAPIAHLPLVDVTNGTELTLAALNEGRAQNL